MFCERSVVFLPSGMEIQVFAVGSGGKGQHSGGGSGHITIRQLVVPDSGEIRVTIDPRLEYVGDENVGRIKYHTKDTSVYVWAGQNMMTAACGSSAYGVG